jgi:hypothetical protein
MSACGTKRKCRNARAISEAGGGPAVPSACRPQPPLTRFGSCTFGGAVVVMPQNIGVAKHILH